MHGLCLCKCCVAEEMSGALSAAERGFSFRVVAFHFPGSCFTALGWCHGSVQMISPPSSLSDNYLKPHPGVILYVGLNQQRGMSPVWI